MTATTVMKLTRKGQLTIPVDIRKELHLEQGDLVEVQLDTQGERPVIKIQPRRDLLQVLQHGITPRTGPLDLKALRTAMEAESGAAALREGTDG